MMRRVGNASIVMALVAVVLASAPALAQDEPPAEIDEAGVLEREELAALTAWRALVAGEVTELDALLEAHAAEHPAAALPLARAEVVRARAEVVDTLPDPTLRLSLSNMPWTRWSLAETPMTGIELGLSWMFPWPGTLESRRQAQLAEADAIATGVGEEVLEVELRASEHYWMIYHVDHVLMAYDEIETVLLDMQRLAEARYRYGTTREADVIQVGLELNRIDERRLELLADRAEHVARLNALLGRDIDAPVVPPKSLDVVPLPPGAADELLARATELRPVFETYEARLEALDTRAEAVEYEAFPELMVGASWRFRADSGFDPVEGEDFIGLTVGTTLPFFSSGRVDDELAVIEREASVIAVERAVVERDLAVRIAAAIARLEELEVQVAFTRETLLVDAHATLETLISVYPTGGADFLDLLQAERRILDLRVELHHLVVEHRRVRDLLARIVSAPVSLAAEPASP